MSTKLLPRARAYIRGMAVSARALLSRFCPTYLAISRDFRFRRRRTHRRPLPQGCASFDRAHSHAREISPEERNEGEADARTPSRVRSSMILRFRSRLSVLRLSKRSWLKLRIKYIASKGSRNLVLESMLRQYLHKCKCLRSSGSLCRFRDIIRISSKLDNRAVQRMNTNN